MLCVEETILDVCVRYHSSHRSLCTFRAEVVSRDVLRPIDYSDFRPPVCATPGFSASNDLHRSLLRIVSDSSSLDDHFFILSSSVLAFFNQAHTKLPHVH
jgi:hypothetical protein